MTAYRVEHYCTPDGADVFGEWLEGLRDAQAKARIEVRIDRLALGLFGDAKALRDGVRELRIDWELVIACITRWLGALSSCCCAAAISGPRRPILRGR